MVSSRQSNEETSLVFCAVKESVACNVVVIIRGYFKISALQRFHILLMWRYELQVLVTSFLARQIEGILLPSPLIFLQPPPHVAAAETTALKQDTPCLILVSF